MRKDKTQYYLNIASAILERSTCLRRQYGAIIVRDDEIIAAGYNGAPRGCKNCTDLGTCKREDLHLPHGVNYELCRAVHAEANAIISASRRDCLGATLYLSGKNENGFLSDTEPCEICRRLIMNAGIEKVICRTGENAYVTTFVSDWEDSI